MRRVLWIFSLGVIGDTLAPNTIASMQAAKEELVRKPAYYDIVLCTGGVFDRKSGQTIPVSHLMRQELGDIPIPILVGDASCTTREDIVGGMKLLDIDVGMATVISEKWHTFGIAKLLRRYYWMEPVEYIHSGYKIGFKEWAGRVIRLGLYHFDRDGTGRLAQWVAKRRKS